MQEKWKKFKDKNICLNCKGPKEQINKTHCDKCEIIRVKKYQTKRNLRKQNNLCIKCGNNKDTATKHCLICLEQFRLRRVKIKTKVLAHYGQSCVCCGEKCFDFLTIDHINNDGYKHRKTIWNKNEGGGDKFYRWIIKNNFPSDLQVYCYNCNCGSDGKTHICPHTLLTKNGQRKDLLMNNYLIPYVIERQGSNERSYDLYSRLLKERIIWISGEIEDDMANTICAQLLFLNFEDKAKDIHLYINSPGGSVTAGLAIYDTIQYVKPNVNCYVIGQAASMGAILTCAGTKGKRFALSSSRIMIHQPWGGASGTSMDVDVQVKEIQKLKQRLYEILHIHTGQDIKKITEDCERDYYLSAEEAKAYGLVDEVVISNKIKDLLSEK